MTGNDIVREETGRLARGMLPLMLAAGGILALCGQASVRMALSLLLGTGYTLALFIMMGNNAARSVLLQPAQAVSSLRRGYAFRYALTGAYIVLIFKLPLFHPWAAILPLFFPKFVLLAGSIFTRKEGK